MNFDESWEYLSSPEKELFQKSCRKLLKQTFIVRDKDDNNRKLYFFITRNPDIFVTYFSFIGFDVMFDRDNGVVMLKNYGENGKIQSNRIQFKKNESIILCCLWTLYMDRIKSGCLLQTITVSMTDLSFELDKYNLKKPIDKNPMEDILNFFSKFNLIDVNGKVGDPECLIRLYPSLQFALDLEEFKNFAETIEKKLKESNNTIINDEGDDEEYDEYDE